MLVGSLFILASLKSRSSLDTPALSNRAKFVIGLFLMFVGICGAVTIFLKGGF